MKYTCCLGLGLGVGFFTAEICPHPLWVALGMAVVSIAASTLLAGMMDRSK